MKRRCIEFIILAIFFLGVAISLPAQVLAQYGWQGNLLFLLTKLTPLNYLIFLLALVCAAASYQASRWLLVVAPVFVFLVAWNNWLFTQVDANYSSWAATFATVFTLFAHGVLFRRDPQKVLRYPSLRWWREAERKSLSMRAHIYPVTGGGFIAKTHDLSLTGMFVALDSVSWKVPSGTTIPNQIQVGVRCSIRIDVNSYQSVECDGRVVRCVEARGSYPRGFAVEFVGISKTESDKLAEALAEASSSGSGSGSSSEDTNEDKAA